MNYRAFLSLFNIFLLLACSPTEKAIQLTWQPLDSINVDLPHGITVHHAIHTGENLRAWYVRVEERRQDIETRVEVSTDIDGRETISEFAQRLGVPVMVNGGYFRMDLNPARHVGILRVNDSLIHAATTSVLRGEQRFYMHRSAIGFDEGDQIGIEWVSSTGDSVFFWDRAIDNKPGLPGAMVDTTFRALWEFRDILGGGPLLVKDGKVFVPVNEEVFFGTRIPDIHPRTAAGITSSGDLILLIVDGRQMISRGVDLMELATIMQDLGCQNAINLDGGGSSSLVVNGHLLNRPAGKTEERQVMSAIAVYAIP